MFHWIEARAFCHATEDEEKVLAALHTVLPEGEVRRDALEGHFGNPLVVLAARTETSPGTKSAWRRIAEALGPKEILQDVEARIDEDLVYHLRLDKQRACLGAIHRAGGADVIDVKAKVATFPRKRELAIQALRESVGGS